MLKIFKITGIAVIAVFLLAGGASADLFNANRPLTTFGSSGSEASLQTIFDDVFGSGEINAVSDQKNNAIWTPAEGAVDAYLITIVAGDQTGRLGIYSYADPSIFYEFDRSYLITTGKVGFDILSDGTLQVGLDEVQNFGQAFGFYWKTDSTIAYTEDSMNSGNGYTTAGAQGGDILALAYLLGEGTSGDLSNAPVYQYNRTFNASGNNDWVLAFEDRYNVDGDFNDAVFIVEDLAPVPIPTAVLLLGSGLIGYVGIRRRKFMK